MVLAVQCDDSKMKQGSSTVQRNGSLVCGCLFISFVVADINSFGRVRPSAEVCGYKLFIPQGAGKSCNYGIM